MRQHQRYSDGRKPFMGGIFGRQNRLYRSTRDSVFAGVCGGIAEHFDLSAWAVRFLFILFTFFAPWLLIVYVILMFVLKKAPPERFANQPEEEEFWNTYQNSRAEALHKVKRAFDKLDQRVQRMEETVTRPGYGMEDEFKNL